MNDRTRIKNDCIFYIIRYKKHKRFQTAKIKNESTEMKIIEKYHDKKNRRNIIKILGIKFTLRPKLKDEIIEMRHEIDTLHNIINTMLNPAEAKYIPNLRKAQLKILEAFNAVDKICRDNDLQYWLDFGTLLGAIRHKGFIPWDDDLDICMIREDYERIYPLLLKHFNENTDWLVRNYVNKHFNFQIRIRHQKMNLGMDIFPVDKYDKENLTPSIKKELSEKMSKAETFFQKKHNRKRLADKNIAKTINDLLETQQKFGLRLPQKNNIKKPILFYGLDYPHTCREKCFEYDTIFPLGKIEFEGHFYNCPNKYKEHATAIYGDIYKFPKKILWDTHFSWEDDKENL